MDRPLVPFVAIATNAKGKTVIESSYCALNNSNDYLAFIAKKLESLQEKSFMTYYEDDSLGNWFIKGLKGGVYIVCTTIDYPKFIAMECLDEHYETSKDHVSSRFRPQKRLQDMQSCCENLSKDWGTMDEGSIAFTLMTQVDAEAREKYSAKIDSLFDAVNNVKGQMESNLHDQFKNMDSAELLEARSHEALEAAKIFKKGSNKIKGHMRSKNNKMIAIGTAGGAAGGLVLGAMIGGPVGAAILTPIFAAGAFAGTGGLEDWGLSQKFVVTKDGQGKTGTSNGTTS